VIELGRDGTARIWDANTGQEQLRVTHDSQVAGVGFSPDGTRLATASADKTARIWAI
jgi:WD40 repeat protein